MTSFVNHGKKRTSKTTYAIALMVEEVGTDLTCAQLPLVDTKLMFLIAEEHVEFHWCYFNVSLSSGSINNSFTRKQDCKSFDPSSLSNSGLLWRQKIDKK